MPNISDITGYTWVGNSSLSLGSSYSYYSINFNSNSSFFDELRIFDNDYDDNPPNSLGYSADMVYSRGTWYNEAYKTIQITGGTDATNATLIAWLEANGTLTAPSTPTKIFDLTTLNLSVGTHTIKVKARGTGYADSVFSNSVSYTVAASGYTVTISFIDSAHIGGYVVINGGSPENISGSQTKTWNDVRTFLVQPNLQMDWSNQTGSLVGASSIGPYTITQNSSATIEFWD